MKETNKAETAPAKAGRTRPKWHSEYAGNTGKVLVMSGPDVIAELQPCTSEAERFIILAAPETLEALKMLRNIALHPLATKADVRRIAKEASAAISRAESEGW